MHQLRQSNLSKMISGYYLVAIKDFVFQSRKIEMGISSIAGLGVFAAQKILKDEIIECVPVLLMSRDSLETLCDVYGADHVLADYVFDWEDGMVALCFGCGSLYNHQGDNANLHYRGFVKDFPRIQFYARHDIEVGDELTIDYDPTRELLFFPSGTWGEPPDSVVKKLGGYTKSSKIHE